MRSSNVRPILAALAAALLTAGCIASSGHAVELEANDGSGDLVIHLVLEETRLTRAQASWSDDGPIPTTSGPVAYGMEAIVMKNGVVLEQAPLYGSTDRAELVWEASRVDSVAQPGDEFQVSVVNATSGAGLASFTVGIESG